MKKLLLAFYCFTSLNAMQKEDISPKVTTLNQSDILPTRAETQQALRDHEQAIINRLLAGGYSLERNEGVVDLPILEWKRFEEISRQLDAFKLQQIENQTPKRIKEKLSLQKDYNDKNYLKAVIIEGPKKCGKTTLAKFIALKTHRPYIIIPPIFFTSSYTAQRLGIYFEFAKTFKNGAVFIIENIPEEDKTYPHGMFKLCDEFDDLNIHKKFISIILTCSTDTQLNARFRSRVYAEAILKSPSYAARLDALKHYLAPCEPNSGSYIQPLAHDLEGANWATINNGILKAKRAATKRAETAQQPLVINKQDIYAAFYETQERIKQCNSNYFWTAFSL